MKISKADVGPRMNLDITDRERESAKSVKERFSKSLDKLDDAVRTVTDIRDAIVSQRPSKKDLQKKYRGRLLRYRRKIKNSFNDLVIDVKKNLEGLSEISDPEMIRLREIIIAEVGEIADGAEAVMDALKDSERDSFTQTLEQLTAQIEKRQKSIKDVVDNQLANHIEHDILGKMKLSELRFKIKRRARVVKQLVNNEDLNGFY